MRILPRRLPGPGAGREMPPRRHAANRGLTVLAGAALAGVLALPGYSFLAGATVAMTSAGADLFVNDEAGSGCSDSGSGTASQPFCTITAAAAVVQPGQTVIVEPGSYDDVTISRSGTPSAPITFLAATSPVGLASVGVNTQTAVNAFLVSNAHDVVISGFVTFGPGSAILVDSSSDITVNGGAAHGIRSPGVRVTGASSNVTISRVSVTATTGAAGVQIDAGVTGAVVTTNSIQAGNPGILATDAPGAVVTGNTLVTHCNPGITVAGTSPGAVIDNNIVETAAGAPSAPAACASPATAAGVTVSAAAMSKTVADHNLIDPASGGALYNWGGTGYGSLASFTAATGQGTNDIAANPGLGSAIGGNVSWYPLSAGSPAIDSADANAPGEPTTDLLANPRADDPAVLNAGTGAGYFDRGAVELQGPITYGGLTANRDAAASPLGVTAAAPVTTSWAANGPIGTDAFYFSDGKLPVLASASSTVKHSFRTAGEYFVTAVESANGFFAANSGSSGTRVVVGADYTPVTPTRILDTRSGIGTGHPGPIPAGGDLVLPISGVGAVSAADISAIVANVTVTQPTAAGQLTVYAVPGTGTATSNINFSAGRTVPGLVTAQLSGGAIRFHNGSGGTVQVIADLEGYYGATGDGFEAQPPLRVLDTRNGTGAPAGAVPAHGHVTLDLSARLPAGTPAAVLNVTVTQPTATGFLTVYPDGQPVPTASNLNFVPGQTVPNLVIVPLTGDKAGFYNGSGGTVQIVADLSGHFATAAAATLVPFGPERIADTRAGLGAPAGAVPAHGTLTIFPDSFNGCVPVCPLANGAVLNVTVTQPKAAGFLTVYPAGQSRPNSSNVNFTAGQTVANLVAVQDVNGGVSIYNSSGGTVQIVADEQGYYIGPP